MNYPENEYLDASNDAAHSRLIHQLIGKTDKHCFELKRKDEHGKTRKIKCYGSGGQGSRIRHAVDGYFFEHRVGTHQENNYFSVIIATGELNYNETNRDTRIVLYYNSPEEYERHLFETVSKATKDQWRSRQKSMESIATTSSLP